jgi:hypothetical protein
MPRLFCHGFVWHDQSSSRASEDTAPEQAHYLECCARIALITLFHLSQRFFRSIWDQRGNHEPIFATMYLNRMAQLEVFIFCPCAQSMIGFKALCHHQFKHRLFALILGIIPSVTTLRCRSTRDQRGNRSPILATMHFYRLLQLPVFFICPHTGACSRPVDALIQDTAPSVITLVAAAQYVLYSFFFLQVLATATGVPAAMRDTRVLCALQLCGA